MKRVLRSLAMSFLPVLGALLIGACYQPTGSAVTVEFPSTVYRSTGGDTPQERLSNGDFSSDLAGWTIWRERNNLAAEAVDARASIHGENINGGIYQQFFTGGAGATVDITGFWETSPAVPNGMWAEVLVIDGARLPVDGSDVNDSQSDVVMIYKNDTWASPSGWSGDMASTSPVASIGTFVASGDTATVVLKTGNLQTVSSGMVFDSISVMSADVDSTPVPNLLSNGDFSSGAVDWSTWTERSFSQDVSGGYLSIYGANHNGGLYQQFSTGGVGSVVSVTGWWESNPAAADGQWAEILIINSDRLPVDGVDVSSSDSDVVVLYKNDTWTTPSGWSGNIELTAPVISTGSFTASDDVATIILKSGNTATAGITGTSFNDIVAFSDGIGTVTQAVFTSSALSGVAPFDVSFDGSGSTHPAGTTLSYQWFVDGVGAGSDATLSKTFSPGTYEVSLTVSASDGSSDTAPAVTISSIDTPPDSGKSKLSIHAGGGNLTASFIQNASPTTVKLLDNFGMAADIKQWSPETEIIGRIYLPSQPVTGDPAVRAQEWWNTNNAIILQYPAVDYWEGYNEVNVASHAELDWYGEFEAARTDILAQYGLKSCIGNFSLGTPDVNDPTMWPEFYPAIDAALAHNGVLGLHEYGTPMQQYFDEEDQEGWLCGRYRKVYRMYLEPTGRGSIPLMITETGVDNEAPVGWKNWYTAEEYQAQLVWYDEMLKEDSYVKGAQIFALEIPGWDDFDITDIMLWLNSYVQ